jgi:hypothetical protein
MLIILSHEWNESENFFKQFLDAPFLKKVRALSTLSFLPGHQ